MITAPPPMPPAQVLAPGPETPLRGEACRTFRDTLELLATQKVSDRTVLNALRARIRALIPRCERGLGRLHPQTLLLRGAEGSLRARLGEERPGCAAYARAAGELRRRSLELSRAPAADPTALVECYECLGGLYLLEGLQDRRWREEALRVKLRFAAEPDPALERDCVAAIASSYGGWLSLKPPDAPRVLEFSSGLCGLLLRRREGEALTGFVAKEAMGFGADGVWRLAATRGDEALRTRLESLLDRLDARTLLPLCPDVLDWAAPLADTPLAAAVDRVLERMETALEQRPAQAGPPDRLRLAKLALARRRPERAAEQLRQGLDESGDARTTSSLIGAAFATPALLEDPFLRGSLLRRIRDILSGPPHQELLASLGSWAGSMEERGWWAEAEPLRRALAEAPSALGPLALNLFMQGRLEEASEACARWRAVDANLAADLLSARIEARLGLPDVARERARQVLEALAGGNDELWRAGGYSELWLLFSDQAGDGELLARVAAEARRRIAPGSRVPQGLDRQPLRMLQALDPALHGEEPAGDALDPLSRAALLMAKAREGGAAERTACLQEALSLTEQALGPEAPALIPILEAQLEQDLPEVDMERAADLMRRAVAIAAAHPEVGADRQVRLRAYLGIALCMGRDSAEGDGLLLETLRRYGELVPRKDEDLFHDLGNLLEELTAFYTERERYREAADLLHAAQEVEFPARPAAELAGAKRAWKDREREMRRLVRLQGLLRAEGLP